MENFWYFWQNFYELTSRVAFCAGPFCVHYYALCYVAALLLALHLGKRYAPRLGLLREDCDGFFVYLEIGIILGARLGYIAIYSPDRWWYLAHPWQIFNPFDAAGNFVGIAGMSYHGACVGAVIGAWLYARKYSARLWRWLDLVALAAPFAYTLGRVGNFLNHELFGRVSEVPWAVYVDGMPRHPSQLYEAGLEGLALGVFMHFLAKKQRPEGAFILAYAALYSLARFVCEFWREPDSQLGFLALNLSMGQWLSLIMFIISALIYMRISRRKNA